MAVSTVTIQSIGEAIHSFVQEHNRRPKQIVLNSTTAVNIELTAGEVMIQRVKVKGGNLFFFGIPVSMPRGVRRNTIKLV